MLSCVQEREYAILVFLGHLHLRQYFINIPIVFCTLHTFTAVWNSLGYICHIFVTHPSVAGSISWLLWTERRWLWMEQVSLWKTRESFGRMLGSGIAGWYVNSICHFLRNLHTSFHNNGQFTVPLGANKGLPLPTSSPAFIVVPFLGDSLSAWSLPLVSIVAISLWFFTLFASQIWWSSWLSTRHCPLDGFIHKPRNSGSTDQEASET